ncbi:MAG TPA: protein kinase [Pyrinomonadaceae bacterium]|nr:protein kinase [Pyrinomonadaceae bacterium]
MLNSGEILSHYKIVSAIGAGGMGEVYLAEDSKLGRQVALKVLLSEVSGDKDRVNRFVQEAKAASALNHPNILTVFEIGNYEGSQYIATELIKGSTLRDHIRSEPISLIASLDIALQITAALGAAHEAGIIHRDIKPENIMIRQDGLVKVLDFGLAKLLPNSAQSIETTLPHLNTKPGMIVGTVAYMSPEQARGRPIDPRSDIFSLGIVLFEMFAGKRPFEGESHLDLISSILKDDPPALRQVVPDLPRQLERIVDKTLRKDRDHRYQSVRDLHIDIEDLRDELKFEAKLNKSVHPTLERAIHETNQDSLLNTQSKLRSALTTSISKTRRFTVLHALVFVLLTASIVGSVWYFRPASGSNAITAVYKTTEVASWTSAPGELFGTASISPDGKLVAFASTRSGTKGIWVTQTNSTDAIQVTNDAFPNTDPIWSPKGDEIAFVSQRPGADGSPTIGIWRVGALGGTPRSIAAFTDGSSQLRRWTSTGKIYYELNGELYAVEIASGTTQKVTSFGDNKAKWTDISADEKTIAYATGTDTDWEIFSSDLATKKVTQIAKGKGKLDKYIAWLPEKGQLFFSTTADEVQQMFATTSGSGVNERIATPESESSIVDAAPDGRSIILSSAKEESNLWGVPVAGGAENPVSRDLNAKLWPDVSPDGQRVVFQSVKGLSSGNRLLRSNIVVKSLKPATDSERPTTIAENGFLPAWSPDGSAVAYRKINGQEHELYLVNASGGGERLLAATGISRVGYSISPYNQVESRYYDWAPDSSSIAFVREQDRIANLYLVSRRDGAETKLTNFSEPGVVLNAPEWSSDGKRIVFSYQYKNRDENGKAKRGLKVVDISSGQITQVFETDRVFRLIGWTSDENGVIIVEPSKEFSGLPPETKVIRIAISGGAESLVTSLKNIYFYNIFLSKDRKQLAYAARDQNLDNIWVLATAGGTPRRLTNNNDSGSYFSKLAWVPDGSSIVFGKQTRFSVLSSMNFSNSE